MVKNDLDSYRMGDTVEFELVSSPSGGHGCYPRWDGNRDRGGSSVWHQGEVAGWTDAGDVVIAYSNPETNRTEYWPFRRRGFFEGRSGWLRNASGRACECGSVATWGSGPHSHWCPMHMAA